ncbi:hypothetical protein AB835_01800 [Candidatus Endobugula sertula]|uniref:Uncharacterized protein n=1 Tax=Candidatus Endobugula sertula TaxID=62101 RepID=A0A1D2QTE9_9GAMM|nr:hypothetical protein AB835_01800 [Candidatus Endobugula sertula]
MSKKQKFDIVFTGKTADGMPLGHVKQKAMELFKLDAEKINQLFQPKAVKLKKNLDQITAEKYQKILTHIGMVVQIKAQVSAKKSPENFLQTSNQQLSGMQSNMPPVAWEQWKLAEPGVRLSSSIKQNPLSIVDCQLTLAPQEGNIVNAAEKPVQAPVFKFPNVDNLSLSSVGEDLLYLDEKPVALKADIDISHLSVKALGGYLLQEREKSCC